MNEGSADSRSENGEEDLKENFRQFRALCKELSINEDGWRWYVDTIGQNIDFSKVFRYLRMKGEASPFSGVAADIVHAQVEFQNIAASLVDPSSHIETLSADELAHVRALGEKLRTLRASFNVNTDGQGLWDRFNAVQMEANTFAQKSQMDRLTDLTRVRREGENISHKEAKERSEGYKNARSEITKIRNRLKKLSDDMAATDAASKDKILSEITALRSELAGHLWQIRKDFPIESKDDASLTTPIEGDTNETKQSAQAESGTETSSDDDLSHLSEEERIDAMNWRGLSDALIARKEPQATRAQAEPVVPRVEARSSQEKAGGTVDTYVMIRRRVHEYEDRLHTVITQDPTLKDTPAYEHYQQVHDKLVEYLDGGYSPEFDFSTVEASLSILEQHVSTLEKNEAARHVAVMNADPNKTAGQTEQDQKSYEQRRVLLNNWRTARSNKEAAYETFLKDQQAAKANRSLAQKLQFWKKEEKPQELLDAEKAYQESRAQYAASLDSALGERLGREGVSSAEELAQKYKAKLAYWFVVDPAYKHLEAARKYVEENMVVQRILGKANGIYKKHSKTIRVIGYVTTFGVAAASGAGLAGVVVALAGKAARAKVAMIGGVATGAVADAAYGALVLRPASKRMDSAQQLAERSYHVGNEEELEKAFLQSHYDFDAASRNRKYVVGAAAFAGGIATGGIANMLASQEMPVHIPVHESTPQPVAPAIQPEVNSPETSVSEPAPDTSSSNAEILQSPVLHSEPVKPIVEVPNYSVESTPEKLLFTFEPGSKIDTLSEALYETWKQNPALLTLEPTLSKQDFLQQMYTAFDQMRSDPTLNSKLLENMDVVSGNIDKVRVGQIVDLEPLIAYINTMSPHSN